MNARLIIAVVIGLVAGATPARSELLEGMEPLISVITEKWLPSGGDPYDTPEYYALAATYPVGLVTIKSGGAVIGFGSGTLVDGTWVLTAAHVIEGADEVVFTIGGVDYVSTALSLQPEWFSLEGYDIGLIELATPVVGVTPAAIYPTTAVGFPGTHVGFGTFGTGLAGEIAYDAKLRAASNMIDAVTPTGDWYRTDFDDPSDPSKSLFGSSTALPLEGMIAHGDSGGGLFATIGGLEYLVGVHSYGDFGSGGTFASYGSEGGSTQIFPHLAWISATTGGAVTAVPEPSSLALVGLASLAAGARRRRRALRGGRA